MPQDNDLFVLSYDSTDIAYTCASLPAVIERPYDVSAVAVYAVDGDFVDVAICRSSRPFDIAAEFELVVCDGRPVPPKDRLYQALEDIKNSRLSDRRGPQV